MGLWGWKPSHNINGRVLGVYKTGGKGGMFPWGVFNCGQGSRTGRPTATHNFQHDGGYIGVALDD